MQAFADIRYALRQLRRAPAFTAAAAATLALGIGANAAIYSVIDAALFHPLPYRDPQRLAILWTGEPGQAVFYSFSYPRFQFFRERARGFADLAAYDDESVTFADGGDPVRLEGGRVSANFFAVLGVAPALGRGFLPEEDAHGARPVALLSDRFWRERYRADPKALGRTVRIDAGEFTIVGVLPAGFQFRNAPVDVWRSRMVDTRTFTPESVRRGASYMTIVGRLAVPPEQARARFAAIDDAYRRDYRGNHDATARAWSDRLEDQVFAGARKPLAVLWGAVGCLLLIACANVANLVMARATGRQREIAVRMALGAGRARIAGQLITEGALLALAGALAAAPIAGASLSLLVAALRRTMPELPGGHLDLRVLAATFAVTAAIGIGFGLTPLLLLLRGAIGNTLRAGGRALSASVWSVRFREALVAGEVALCLVLLTAAAMLGRSFLGMSATPAGLLADRIVEVPLDLMPDRYQTGEAHDRFYDAVLRRTSDLPGVASAAIASRIDLVQHGLGYPVEVEGAVEAEGAMDASRGDRTAEGRSVSPAYFGTLGIRLLRGRDFSPRDSTAAPRVTIVNEAFARRFFPGQDPIGRHVIYSADRIRCEVVGLVRDVRFVMDTEAEPTIYLPLSQRPWLVARLLVRPEDRAGSGAALVPAICKAIQAVDADQAVGEALPLGQMIANRLGQPRTTMFTVAVFAVLALILAAIGIYGVTTYTVAQRAREIGIRMALGADAAGVRALVFRQSLRVLAVGLLVGAPASAAASRIYAGLLFGMDAADPVTLGAVSATLAVVALAASGLPAVAAAAIDPLAILRAE